MISNELKKSFNPLEGAPVATCSKKGELMVKEGALQDMKFIRLQKVWYDKTISCPLFDVLSLWDERVPELRPIFLKANNQRAIFQA